MQVLSLDAIIKKTRFFWWPHNTRYKSKAQQRNLILYLSIHLRTKISDLFRFRKIILIISTVDLNWNSYKIQVSSLEMFKRVANANWWISDSNSMFMLFFLSNTKDADYDLTTFCRLSNTHSNNILYNVSVNSVIRSTNISYAR